MSDFTLRPLKQVARPNGPHGRSTWYRWNQQHPGLLRRIPGSRDTYVHMPTYREIEATAEPLPNRAATEGK